MNIEHYAQTYGSLTFNDLDDGVLELVLSKNSRLNAADADMHGQLAYVWRDIDLDNDVSVVLVRGEGKAFSAGGDYQLIQAMIDDDHTLARVWKEARDLVYNIVNCSKPVVSAIHGPAGHGGRRECTGIHRVIGPTYQGFKRPRLRQI